jgi:ethanolamine utilization protein EutN
MRIGTVTSAVVAATRHPALGGAKLLIVAFGGDGGEGDEVLAVDAVGAGVGDRVIVASGDHPVALVRPDTPTDAVIVGIIEPRS